MPWRWCAMSWPVYCYCSTVKVLDSNISCWDSFTAHYLHQPRFCAGKYGYRFHFDVFNKEIHLSENEWRGAHCQSLAVARPITITRSRACVNRAGDSLMMSAGPYDNDTFIRRWLQCALQLINSMLRIHRYEHKHISDITLSINLFFLTMCFYLQVSPGVQGIPRRFQFQFHGLFLHLLFPIDDVGLADIGRSRFRI